MATFTNIGQRSPAPAPAASRGVPEPSREVTGVRPAGGARPPAPAIHERLYLVPPWAGRLLPELPLPVAVWEADGGACMAMTNDATRFEGATLEELCRAAGLLFGESARWPRAERTAVLGPWVHRFRSHDGRSLWRIEWDASVFRVYCNRSFVGGGAVEEGRAETTLAGAWPTFVEEHLHRLQEALRLLPDAP